MISTNINKISENVYPKGDLNEILEKLQNAGLEPFGPMRARGSSSKINNSIGFKGSLSLSKN